MISSNRSQRGWDNRGLTRPEVAVLSLESLIAYRTIPRSSSCFEPKCRINFSTFISNLAAVPGIAFGYDEGIRLSYCTTLDVLNEGLTRFEQFCREH
jgi:hypothetical protein